MNEDDAFVQILEFITNTFYRTEENKNITVELTSTDGANYYDQNRIMLSKKTMEAFKALGLPRFVVYYHELGHHLYSQGWFKFVSIWRNLKAYGPKQWQNKYHHLLNWLEDYYIENRLRKEHSYLTDVLSCLKKIPPDYDITNIKYAFNHWYIYKKPTPALSSSDQKTFVNYINRLEGLRSIQSVRFGYSNISLVTKHKNVETHYMEMLVEFYTWCETKGIFEKDKVLPPLHNPNNYLVIKTSDKFEALGNNIVVMAKTQKTEEHSGGSHDDHSHEIGHFETYIETPPIQHSTILFKDELVEEQRFIDQQLLDMSQRLQANNYTLEGLFTSKHKDSSIIQSRIIVPNFYNPYRLLDQVLFQEKQHTYMNVAIYRDISLSVANEEHALMSAVCEKLYEEIPVEITYYLYSSGKISIIEVPYIKWDKIDKVPREYLSNPLYKQLSGGTNSDAIADVITEQFSEKWLNIIITDGDLHALMARENIHNLLKNVFIVSVGQEVQKGLLGIRIDTIKDLEQINSVLSTINLDR